MEEGFAGTGQASNQRLDCTAMVAAGRIDDGIGNPDEVTKNLETFENVGVDQVIFIQQGGNRVGLELAPNEAANRMAI